MLRYTTVPLQEGEHNAKGGMDGGFQLLDPMGQRVYFQLPNSKHKAGAEADPESEKYAPRTLGNELPHTVMGEAEYVLETHFPPLPEKAERITVLTPGTTGEFTGIPVIDMTKDDDKDPDKDASRDEDDEDEDEDDEGPREVRPGDVVELPVVSDPMPKEPGKYARPLYGITQSGKEERDTARTRERVTFRSEGLFRAKDDGDQAGEEKGEEKDEKKAQGVQLTNEGESLLAGAGLDASGRIDPDKPLLTIVAHTSGKGTDDENLKTSQAQATAVRKFLEDEFGEEFQYKAEVRGSSQPIVEEKGSGKEAARKRNQRVEIIYDIVPKPVDQEESAGADEDGQPAQGGEGQGGGEDRAGSTHDPEPLDDGTADVQEPGSPGTPDDPSPSPSTSADPEGEGDAAEPGGAESVPRPAPYRAEDASPVATAEATIDEQDYRMSVFPFYRDGSYLVANFQITNKSPEEIDEEATPFADPTTYPGADFGSFVVVNPETGTAYHGLRIGQRNSLSDKGAEPTYLGPASYPYVTRTNSSNRVWMYIAAPPPWVTTVNFDAGAYGVIEDVPVE
ncbi:hypothetical protein CDO52_21675 [Nocardiopsis gilva YIM 90087]|uniref:OmpA-like domain-containing protein n=1 Tax=Nocardiopsis gilva YIM 90087 TaxID=1235441 RepID=A0A223SAA9_9ACTN|nr:hypothetical protein CDO52_21675 [Nocardiopsis gilva YIM 90087]